MAFAAIDFVTNHAELDLGGGSGDTDRSASFTAPRNMYLYLEVSTIPGAATPYTLTVDGPN